ncbi:MAG: isoleucine--tRNA ligase [Endomicrobiia bacterium]
MKDYSKTVNLPKTDFPMKANLAVREPEILSFWKENNIYKKILEKNKSGKKFILHDGPPYANGHIHLGHALNKILKDIVVKYKAIRGFYTPFIPGWDCHGLPIEHQLFKELGIDKRQIDIVSFRKKAKDFAKKFVDIQKEEFIRLGVFGDWNNPYLTMDYKYESNIVRVFKELAEAGYIYRSKKPIYWCPYCETALAEAEVEYADHISPSIYVKFPVVDTPYRFVLIWTTTPWTLPANVAIAFHPDAEYVLIKCNGEEFILSKALLKNVSEITGLKEYKILQEFKGEKLENIKCKNPVVDRISTGILADFVTLEDGTGCVHIAPGHGAEDYQVGLKYKLPVISPVDSQGIFTEEVPEFNGHRVFAANPLIVNKLKEKGLLLHEEKITHSYPHCWRCKHAIIFRATDQWFLSVEYNNLRERMIKSVEEVKWIPDYGINRIKGMLELRPDWCLSRQRYWGVPIPAIYCNKCGETFLDRRIIEKFEKIVEKEGTDAWFIKPVEDFLPDDFNCDKCSGSDFRKETDILDVWFDSGVSHEAVLKIKEELDWPADMYLEGSDQHRGWFQTSLIPAVALHNSSPYRIVLTHGFTVDGEGRKMSKSLGNVIAPQEITQKYGAEILRLWVSSSDYKEDVRISSEIIERLVETYRKIRNTIRFLLGNLYDFSPKNDTVGYKEMLEIDRWVLHKLQKLTEKVIKAYENYEFHLVISEINGFCVVDLSSFYMDVLKDRLYTFRADSEERRSAQTVIYQVLLTLLKLVSPVLSFTAEEAWQNLRKIDGSLPESIFLTELEDYKKEFLSEELERKWEKLLDIREKVNIEIEKARRAGIIKSSLESKVIIDTGDKEALKFLDGYKNDLPAILIVSQVEVSPRGASTTYRGASITDQEIKITVLHADGKKCPRCWNWSTEITDDSEICPKCKKALESF